jgi:thiosulfate/3-mercaptopyruvate sulfurtransferase
MTRYVIIGAGAVGGTVAAQLHGAGNAVVLVARGRNLEALRSAGLRYIRPDGEHLLDIPAVGGPDELELTSDDILVLATKSQDTEAVLQQWSSVQVHLGDGTNSSAAHALPILILQNGLENERAALRRFASVIGAVVWLPASYLTPGEVVSPGAPTVGAFWLGAYPDDGHHTGRARADEIATDLRIAGFEVQVVPDIIRWKAGKLLGNLENSLDALYPPSALRTAAVRALRDEARVVLRGAGFDIADLVAESKLDLSGLVIQSIEGRERGSSTWQSLARGESLENDFLNGEVLLQARLSGVDAPLNTAVQERVRRAVADSVAARSLDDTDLARLLPSPILIAPTDLQALLDNGSTPLLLDVRWALGDPHGRDHYLGGHIPSARYVDLDTELAGSPAPGAGRHPLPAVDDLQAAARRWGLSRGQSVIVYDNSGGLAAARAWWLLRWAGVPDVRLLDGGLSGWVAAGRPLETGEPTGIEPGDVELSPGHLPVLTADAAAGLARTGFLLDARAGERYRGEVEPVDPRAGHIPGAISAPTAENLTAGGAFQTAEQLRDRFRALGVVPSGGPVGVYCGSGVTAAHQVAALAVAGIDAALYPGSWSAWSSEPDRPIATGPSPRSSKELS